MLVRKIIVASLGGVGKVALETAEKWNLLRGGNISKRKLLRDRTLAERHRIKASDARRVDPILFNVRGSDGTLVFLRERAAGETRTALRHASKEEKPLLQIDVAAQPAFSAAQRIHDWLYENRIRILFVAGPDGPMNAAVARKAGDILETVFHLDTIASPAGDPLRFSKRFTDLSASKPCDIDQAVRLLDSALSLREKTRIARSSGAEKAEIHFRLGEFIRNELRWWEDNPRLMDACLAAIQTSLPQAHDASDVIIERLVQSLRESHSLRIVT